MGTIRLAAIQLNVSDDRTRNLGQATELVARAASQGAQFVALPENTDQIAPRAARIAHSESLDGVTVSAYRRLAEEHHLWLLVGSFAERAEDGRIHNTSVMIDPSGAIAGTYRKIHLFDANPPDGPPYRESEAVTRGNEVVTVATSFATVGMSICYDLRFPELYRQQSARGATLLTIPSAFTVPTGKAHWEILLRARAIENLSYVIAPAQVGEHGHDRRSYGHALIIDPWGRVLADAGDAGPGVIFATYDPREVEHARQALPALDHRRL